MLHPGAQVGTVGINYLPVNMAPAIDDIVVVPGARANAQSSSGQQQQSVPINFSTPSSTGLQLNTEGGREPISGVKDKSAVTARWVAHDDNGDELILLNRFSK